ncbi:uncharacterized protein PHACADRAFT_166026 [Phanerochaete carnosa HHB-10118-sp]|uniref:MYND-type domain-containing protein n=1 Tax=Phanerochaete carnosa (strain HHB-10118-sp) TaxID=650164 RepID=K5VXZ0_PHACS|nr:uncharacterized protein PHACADRAFT_166026 [Phanerochaete carnosa HHB-10118-sp]EKM51464.1 hypothetical protein PHACADRAFT_166026 [Phanerochaete carnosa HHB-10118-sp]
MAYMQEERVPPLLTRIHQACYYCFKPGTDDSALKRCSRCRRVCYDRCQKANWKTHKALCSAYCEMQSDIAALDQPSGEPTEDVSVLNDRANKRVQSKMRILGLSLGRELTVMERNLIGWEPRCLACARTEEDIRAAGSPAASLKPCANCRLFFFCSEEHRIFAQHAHSHVPDPDSARGLSQCEVNFNIRQDSIVREVMGGSDEPVRWAPERVKRKWESLDGRTWEGEHAAELQDVGLPPLAVGPFLCSATDGLAFPMTILWALEKLNEGDAWTKKAILTIHVLGATQEELMRAMQFEEILHRLPTVYKLNLVLIGPEMKTVKAKDGTPVVMDTCPRCFRRGRQRVQYHYASLYHDFVASQGSAYTTPNLAIAFNSGCGSEETESWLPTIKSLVEKKVPSVFTAFNRDEVKLDRAILESAGAVLLPGLTGLSPWASQVLHLEPNKVKGFYSNNRFIAGVFI